MVTVKIVGLGMPELFIVFLYVIFLAITCAVAYFVIKAAVKRGTVEAFDELKKSGRL